MRIPTLFGVALIVIAIVIGVFFFSQKNLSKPTTNINPAEVQVVNLSDTQASVVWTTDQPSLGTILFSKDNSLNQTASDIRDQTGSSQKHLTHFVTLTNLVANTSYSFKIKNDSTTYPDQALQFKTTAKGQSSNLNPPLIGVVLDTDLKPVNEAIVFLEGPNNINLATLTTTAGNFILPLVNLTLTQPTEANLVVYQPGLKSQIKVILPSQSPLPEIILGQDSDFTVKLATDSTSSAASASATPAPNYDLNGDGKINSFDRGIISSLIGRKVGDKTFNKKADLNDDGLISKADLDLLNKQIK